MLPALLLFPLWASQSPAPPDSTLGAPPAVQAVRVTGRIELDGRLDEPAWLSAPAVTGFRQREPDQGAEPTEPTEARLLYDDAALYVGARLHDSAPDSIVARLARRDAEITADRFVLFVDPYNDRRSGFYFAVNAGGTLSDGVLYNDDWNDDSWDGVWEGRAVRDERGWSVEMRIPYSQLRFHRQDVHEWGINFRRDLARRNEQSYLVYTPRNESGFVSRFVRLTGLREIRAPRRVEIMPYVTTRAAYTGHDAGDPFNDGSSYTPAAGADLKIGLGSNLTLDATINPDFGQVEVDPAVVNLSDVESFFQEKRPFFVEGSSIFNFGYGGARNYWGFNWASPDLFYTRRIGRTPQGSLPEADFSHVPAGTRILGAAKLTGKVGRDVNVGMVHALTARESARLRLGGLTERAEVEPLTYYGVYRAQREIDAGRQGIGFMATATARQFQEDRLRDELNGGAYVLGVDGWTFLDREREWVLTGWTSGSHVRGSRGRITNLQHGALHYLQRPDASHVEVDSAATAMNGLAGRFHINKQKGRYFFNSALGFITPRFHSNDLGFMFRTDQINMHVGGGRQWSEPNSFRRHAEGGLALFRSYDFEGNVIWTGGFHFGFLQLLNYYSLDWALAYNPRTVNNRRTRGGPLTINPPGYQINFGVRSDDRKAWMANLNFFTYQSGWSRETQASAELTWRPAANVSLSVGPQLYLGRERSQWIGVYDDPLAAQTFGRRYVFAELDQVTLSAGIRMNWTFTPQLSFQLYAQPLLSAGDYSSFKELLRPNSYEFLTYGRDGSTFDEATLVADPDGPGAAAPLDFDDPDFSFISLRGNAVFRWEYRPGSTVYLVWTQSRSDSETFGAFDPERSLGRLRDARADNIFLVKLNYWLAL